jgi:hypothetical protein
VLEAAGLGSQRPACLTWISREELYFPPSNLGGLLEVSFVNLFCTLLKDGFGVLPHWYNIISWNWLCYQTVTTPTVPLSAGPSTHSSSFFPVGQGLCITVFMKSFYVYVYVII